MAIEIKNQTVSRIITSLAPYLQGKENALKLSLLAYFSKGHLLIEDLPGLGKTRLAVALARALGLSFGRVQCTNDLLPSDITGLSVFNKSTNSFDFHKGPIFNNIILVDEINRATPKTQSALLEAMAEEQVTIEGKTYRLPEPFFLIATQNPLEHFGTFPLPDNQLDRFLMRISIGYPPRDFEKDIIRGGSKRDTINLISPVIEVDDSLKMQKEIRQTVIISEKMLDYIIEILQATRNNKYIKVGLSTRGALALSYVAKTSAYFQDRDYIIPEDIIEYLPYTAPHRLILHEQYKGIDQRELIQSILQEVKIPL
ncbi:MAG: MoxR family ATPase [Thermodesulfovibrionales bacterium]|nr:MoxR family ATPase [Thermodesulfovibrionales bacterium]